MNCVKTVVAMLVGVLMVCNQSRAFAEAQGVDMWTRVFEQWGLFQPHPDHCDSSTEEFFSVTGSGSRGFCMEKNERSAATWDVARDDCAADGKRLPEPGEFKFACINGGAVTNMTDDYEWVTNFAVTIEDYTGGAGVAATKMGGGGCARGSYDFVAWNTGASAASLAYRCVR